VTATSRLMSPLSQVRDRFVPDSGSPLWLRLSSLLVLVLAVGLFLFSLRSDIYGSRFSSILVPALLVALAMAVFLNISSLLNARKKQRESDYAFHKADCEFTSIFQHVLDGILILDDYGNCLDANPAVSKMLGLSQNALIGQSIAKFFVDREAFAPSWNALLRQQHQRGHADLLRGDGSPLFVDYTAAANYIPGRHVVILCDVTERKRTELSLRKSEERFQQMASHIQEVFWMMDAETTEVIYVNKAFETLTGRRVTSIYENPSSYAEVIHSEDRVRVLAKFAEAMACGKFDEEFRIIRGDTALRWVWVKAFPVQENRVTRWLVGTAQDVTSRKHAEIEISKHLEAAEAARAEAEALRKSTLALTQNLAMDTVLDTLLESLAHLVPFDSATVLLAEGESRLLVAREAPLSVVNKSSLTLDATENTFLQRALIEQKAIFLPDTANESEWKHSKVFDRIRCWLGVPLVASGRVIGLLSLGADAENAFSQEHLRVAKSLAIPAAVAIQNARMYERAEIYAAELELRLHELRETQRALRYAESQSLHRGQG
jgi:PAS domain S-box-containing protein